jgi:Subtilase family
VRLLAGIVGLFGMSRGLLVLVFGLLVLGFVSGSGDRVSVIVMPEKGVQARGFSANSNIESLKITHKYSAIGGFAVEIDIEDLDNLKRRFGGAVFIDDREYSITLDLSIPLVGADDSWVLNSAGINLTGAGQTVCVIDTGVNYSHVALGGCYGNNDPNSSCRVLGGYDYIGDDDDPFDDNGHGTHVAGTVSSNDSTYSGVAPDSKIIAMKVLNSAGSSESGSDILAAIDWCVANASKFNISVISMSLGDNSTYNSYCVDVPWDNAISAAVAAGIPVVVSAGNCDKPPWQTSCTTGVAFPACIENATRVGAVNDVDVISYMRGALFQLMAPGIGIISSVIGGGFGSKSGTSMAAPHVSGAIVLMKQYLELSGQSKSVYEIEDILNDTGKFLDDSAESGYNFSRINIYDSLLSLDNVAPNVTLVSPVDNHNINLSVNQSFVCNASDWQLANVTFKIWNSSGLYYNESMGLTGTGNETSFDLVDIPNGRYDWNCFVYDGEGNSESGSSNFSLTVGGVGVTLDFPENGSATNDNESFFNCSSWSDAGYELDNVTFYLWNSSGDLVNSSVRDISGVENDSVFNWTFEYEDDYVWNCFVFNSNSNVGDGGNFSVRYDVTSPVIAGLGVSTGTSSGVISWTTNELANSSVWVSGGSWSNSGDYVLNHSVSVSGLSSSTGYTYDVTSCDKAGNCKNGSGSFETDVVAPSGGGGGSSSVVDSDTYSLEFGEFSEGVSKVLPEGGLVQFNLNSVSHSFSVLGVEENSAEILIESDPIYVTFYPGEERKFNLSSEYYYDLFVRLNGVDDGEANFSIRKILEVIEREEEIEVEEVEALDGHDSGEPEEVLVEEVEEEVVKGFEYFYLFWAVPLVLIVLFFIGKSFKGGKVKKSRKKKGGLKLPKLVKKKNGAQRVPKYIGKNNGKNKKVKA